MKQEDVERLRELEAKATPAPWVVCGDGTKFWLGFDGEIHNSMTFPIRDEACFALAVAARNSLAALLAERDALVARLALAERVCEAIGEQSLDTSELTDAEAKVMTAYLAWFRATSTDALGAVDGGGKT